MTIQIERMRQLAATALFGFQASPSSCAHDQAAAGAAPETD